MTLPPLDKRLTTHLVQEIENLQGTIKRLQEIAARDPLLQVAFAPEIQKIDSAIESINTELMRRHIGT